MARIDPTLAARLKKYGAKDFSACYNCGNCTAVCSLTAKDANYPRIFLRYGSVGMKDEMLSAAEPWLCYACGECSTACPRDAGPGDYMAAARKFAIAHHEPTGLTRLLFTNNPFAIVFTSLLAVFLGVFMTMASDRIDPDNAIKRWIFETFKFEVIHDLGMVIFSFMGLTALIGVILMSRRLFKGMTMPKNPLAAAWDAVRNVLVEAAAMRRYRKCLEDEEPYFKGRKAIVQPWFLHWNIMWGFIGLLMATILDFMLKDPATPTFWPTRILGTVAGVMMMYGATMTIIYRIKGVARQYRNTQLADWALLGALFLAGLTGFWMEVAVMAHLTQKVNEVVFIVHTIISMELVILFAFSKFAHAFYRPLALFAYFLKGGKKAA